MPLAEYEQWLTGNHSTYGGFDPPAAQAEPATSQGTSQPPATGEDTGSARLSYSTAAGTRDALRAFVDANPGDAEARAQLATEEQRVRDLGIRAGVIAPPKKFVAPTYAPAPKDGWFREAFSEGPETEALRAIYQKNGNTVALKALDEQSGAMNEQRHRWRQIGKAVEQERARITADRKAGVNGHIPEWREDEHLREFEKSVKVEPFRPPTWLEKAPAGSVAPELVKTEDLASMTTEMKVAWRKAMNREPTINAIGVEIEGSLGPFRLASADEPAPEPIPVRPGTQAAIVEVNGRKFVRSPINPDGVA